MTTMQKRLREETEREASPWEIANGVVPVWYQEDDEKYVTWYKDGLEVGPNYA